MDLGIRGRTAIVCASSQGLGKVCARALAEAGVSLVINGRNRALLEQTADEIRQATGVEVTAVIADVSTSRDRRRCSRPAPRPTYSSTTTAARRFATSAT
jgi:3-oxoacyl-[acyl-carrier protein] reductase